MSGLAIHLTNLFHAYDESIPTELVVCADVGDDEVEDVEQDADE